MFRALMLDHSTFLWYTDSRPLRLLHFRPRTSSLPRLPFFHRLHHRRRRVPGWTSSARIPSPPSSPLRPRLLSRASPLPRAPPRHPQCHPGGSWHRWAPRQGRAMMVWLEVSSYSNHHRRDAMMLRLHRRRLQTPPPPMPRQPRALIHPPLPYRRCLPTRHPLASARGRSERRRDYSAPPPTTTPTAAQGTRLRPSRRATAAWPCLGGARAAR